MNYDDELTIPALEGDNWIGVRKFEDCIEMRMSDSVGEECSITLKQSDIQSLIDMLERFKESIK